ncbi:MAG: S9 family peptidase [Bacteroides sp.]|nr:S9 family peptidase [Bacteroides sp.]
MKRFLFLQLSMAMALGICAENVNITPLKYAGPFPVMTPFQVDSLDVNSKKFDTKSLLDLPLSVDLAINGKPIKNASLKSSKENALHLLSFSIDNSAYTTGTINIEGIDNYRIFVDGEQIQSPTISLTPARHDIVVKCLTLPDEKYEVKISVDTDTPQNWNIVSEDIRRYTLMDVLTGKRITMAELSPSGKYLLEGYSYTDKNGNADYSYQLVDPTTGTQLFTLDKYMAWMPKSDKLYFIRERDGKRQLVTFEPVSKNEEVIAKDLPKGQLLISPAEDYVILSQETQGPTEDSDIYEILQPEDRQPGWRNRRSLLKYDLKSGLTQPLTFGYKGVNFNDISADGSKLLFSVSEPRLQRRPTTVTSLYVMDINTLDTRCILDKEEFIGLAAFSPDAKKIAITGTPEAFASAGKNVKDGQIPSMIDNQLFIIDINSGEVTPLTKFFNPSVQDFIWSSVDGNIYFTAEDRDLVSLFRLNPANGKIDNLDSREEVVSQFSIASGAPKMTYYGQGAMNSDRLYTLDLNTLNHQLADDVSAERLKGIKLGKCEAWDYVTSRGDTINARYVLPADFDPSKKYPMIVNYYGGCSPTSRNFETRYPHHAYAAQGYVVLLINPSGASGFGQEFSARHVNTAGKGVAEDIIEGVKKFTADHPFVNADKIGCIGASYGGFMTQYLQTVTDIFAAAISHAGISDHTSYWGEGYWGYSYSEVSMADSYPWKDKELYVDQSPLYNADKIHTPILFLHGDSDHNVPVGESIQMFTALKLLDRPTAFVAVKDQDHQILDFHKRQKWQNTIFAWFAKYLQDDPSWWDALYPPKSL